MSRNEQLALLAIPRGLGDNGRRIFGPPSPRVIPPMRQDDRATEQNPDLKDSTLLSSWIRRGQQGDLAAMEKIYESYKNLIFGLAFRLTSNRVAAEDILQDTFIKIFTHIRDVRNEETFPAWIYRIALNTCYSYLRARKNRSFRTVPLQEIEGQKEEAVEDRHEDRLAESIDRALGELPEKLKTVFLLHDVQGFKHGEIARLLGCSVGTSKSQLFKARLKIRKYLKAHEAI